MKVRRLSVSEGLVVERLSMKQLHCWGRLSCFTAFKIDAAKHRTNDLSHIHVAEREYGVSDICCCKQSVSCFVLFTYFLLSF